MNRAIEIDFDYQLTKYESFSKIERLKRNKTKRLRNRNKRRFSMDNIHYQSRSASENANKVRKLHENVRVIRIIDSEFKMNQSWESICNTLNDLGYKTNKGLNWTKMDVYFTYKKFVISTQ